MLTITHPSFDTPVFKANTFVSEGSNGPIVLLNEQALGGNLLKIQTLQIAGISAFVADLNFPAESLLTVSLDEPALLMCFTLAGHLNIDGDATGSFTLREQAHFTFPATPNSNLALYVSGEAKLFVVCFYGDVLPKLFSEEERLILRGKLAGKTWRKGRLLTYSMADIISSVMYCADNSCLHQIFMAAKMLELLFISLEQLKQSKAPGQTDLAKANDLEKLEKARRIIKENLKHPYSLIDLAHKVGLNDFKLKKGFREAFGTTVFGYLLEMRMEKATGMLNSGMHKVGEVAHEVGYKNAHHFSVAFKKKFGHLPSKAVMSAPGEHA